MRTRKEVGHSAPIWNAKAISYLVYLFLMLGLWGTSEVLASEWYVSTTSSASTPEGYRLISGSAAIDAGMLLYENPLDFWNGQRPHLPKTGVSDLQNPKTGFYELPKTGFYDIGAHEFGMTGKAHIGLDLATFPFEVAPYKLQFRAKPKR